jgi:hypothetical protein
LPTSPCAYSSRSLTPFEQAERRAQNSHPDNNMMILEVPAGYERWLRDQMAEADAAWARSTASAPNPTRLSGGGGEGPPRSLQKIVGSLDYYQARHEDFRRRHPGKSPPSYFLQFGGKNVRRFTLG